MNLQLEKSDIFKKFVLINAKQRNPISSNLR